MYEDGNYCKNCGEKLPDVDFPFQGDLYVYEESSDVIQRSSDWDWVEPGSDLEQRLRSVIRETTYTIRVTEDGQVEVMEVN
jgi:hypothetical protein